MGKQAEEQQKFGERVSGAVSSTPASGSWSWEGGRVLEEVGYPQPCPVCCQGLGALGKLWGALVFLCRARTVPPVPTPIPALPQVIYFQSALDKLNEAIKLAKVCSCCLGLGASHSPAGPWAARLAGGRLG